ncbi:MAG: hypothetical protein A2381_10940 [Bdellovibrionales bacterium RIFOXYB1_FULL_37_110]|nr:MAG: hypothetical protein A2181_07080 [Bdellovibrionales bacterium RIFOXYA1_FULL_38_20]OFZ51180.1 MAG: hypothetical protein A2417_17925 [Bdellovibrionales bacterium RIFOXYC1_FULL_37_79]OFZ54362.1 MAG: hypothetical protein A2328_06215 [Bdellovibrionales bacterium RIFOXYB2_FULL_36_6]OFZ61286.1 MAG: hypothetical protein A2381_10940 [Bdellovibrionales bacterium RIFOXYB1_FULL_37_110]OFZ62149.1 MAG: hypothetical protein A2577_14515 [Bdellovibrionales bacterium RIFOXYD1_FULL_36_51]
MFDRASYLIMRHLEFLNLLCEVSRLIIKYATKQDVDRVSLESANRDKIINILIGFHDQINQLFKNSAKENLKSLGLDEILKTWAFESEQKIAYIQELDVKILELLNQEKQKTKEDIQNVFLNRQKFGGYNLHNVK